MKLIKNCRVCDINFEVNPKLISTWEIDFPFNWICSEKCDRLHSLGYNKYNQPERLNPEDANSKIYKRTDDGVWDILESCICDSPNSENK